MPGCCELCKIVWAQVFHDVTELLLGSPAALLRLHRCLLLEALVAGLLLSTQVVVFLAYFRHSEPEHITLLLCLVLVPMAVTLARLPLLLRMERRCRVLADSFITQNAAVATGLVQLVRGRPSKVVQLISVFLAIWYVLCVIWNYTGPPCKDLTEAIEFWKLTPDAVPCETFEASCTLLMMANVLLGGMLTAAPWGVRYFQSQFLPKRSRGIPLQLLNKLPEFVHGATGAPHFSDPDVTCAICIEALQQGDVCRQLPCNHTFHKTCVDSWLVRSATCPMRCPTDLWSLATGKPSTAFEEEPSGDASDPARAGSLPTSPASVLGRSGHREV